MPPPPLVVPLRPARAGHSPAAGSRATARVAQSSDHMGPVLAEARQRQRRVGSASPQVSAARPKKDAHPPAHNPPAGPRRLFAEAPAPQPPDTRTHPHAPDTVTPPRRSAHRGLPPPMLASPSPGPVSPGSMRQQSWLQALNYIDAVTIAINHHAKAAPSLPSDIAPRQPIPQKRGAGPGQHAVPGVPLSLGALGGVSPRSSLNVVITDLHRSCNGLLHWFGLIELQHPPTGTSLVEVERNLQFLGQDVQRGVLGIERAVLEQAAEDGSQTLAFVKGQCAPSTADCLASLHRMLCSGRGIAAIRGAVAAGDTDRAKRIVAAAAEKKSSSPPTRNAKSGAKAPDVVVPAYPSSLVAWLEQSWIPARKEWNRLLREANAEVTSPEASRRSIEKALESFQSTVAAKSSLLRDVLLPGQTLQALADEAVLSPAKARAVRVGRRDELLAALSAAAAAADFAKLAQALKHVTDHVPEAELRAQDAAAVQRARTLLLHLQEAAKVTGNLAAATQHQPPRAPKLIAALQAANVLMLACGVAGDPKECAAAVALGETLLHCERPSVDANRLTVPHVPAGPWPADLSVLYHKAAQALTSALNTTGPATVSTPVRRIPSTVKAAAPQRTPSRSNTPSQRRHITPSRTPSVATTTTTASSREGLGRGPALRAREHDRTHHAMLGPAHSAATSHSHHSQPAASEGRSVSKATELGGPRSSQSPHVPRPSHDRPPGHDSVTIDDLRSLVAQSRGRSAESAPPPTTLLQKLLDTTGEMQFKVHHDSNIRVFSVPLERPQQPQRAALPGGFEPPSFARVHAALCRFCHVGEVLRIRYQDSDGDFITVASEEEWRVLLGDYYRAALSDYGGARSLHLKKMDLYCDVPLAPAPAPPQPAPVAAPQVATPLRGLRATPSRSEGPRASGNAGTALTVKGSAMGTANDGPVEAAAAGPATGGAQDHRDEKGKKFTFAVASAAQGKQRPADPSAAQLREKERDRRGGGDHARPPAPGHSHEPAAAPIAVPTAATWDDAHGDEYDLHTIRSIESEAVVAEARRAIAPQRGTGPIPRTSAPAKEARPQTWEEAHGDEYDVHTIMSIETTATELGRKVQEAQSAPPPRPAKGGLLPAGKSPAKRLNRTELNERRAVLLAELRRQKAESTGDAALSVTGVASKPL